MDYLLAIKADRNTCKPYTGPGWIGHVVRVSDSPHMTIVNEFTDGGTFEHEDCAPASLQSWFIDKTLVRMSIRTIEAIAGTNLNGTGFTGLIVAGQHFDLEIKFSGDNPAAGYIMNPGGFSEIVDISQFPEYLAATQGGCLVLPNIAIQQPPVHPVPPPTEEDDDVKPILATTHRNAGQGPDPHGNGAVYLVKDWPYGPKRWLTNPAFLADYEAACGPLQSVDPLLLDRIEEGPHIDAIASPAQV